MTAPRSWLTGDDLIALSARIAAELDTVTDRVPSIAEDFNRCLRTAGEAIGRPAWDFNASELDELACMVIDAIAGRVADRLEYLRGEIRAERISYGELAELQALAAHITPGDVELLEWAFGA